MLKPRIKELIDERGLKQTFVAEKIGVTPQQLNAWINKRAFPRLDRAYDLANVLNCNIDDLYVNED